MEKTELPAEVVYYNLWTGFGNKDVGKLFECIPIKQLGKLKPGSTIWLDAEQPSGKVYGFNRAEVLEVKEMPSQISIRFKGPAVSGGVTVEKKKGWHKVHRCTNDARLLELIAQFPLATETGTVLTMSATSREHLLQQGATLIRA